ncbi:hypothetical protein EK904_014713 [Melospiza melodia maxima]|nr:hypothetical protein EK904_014713 [Melospiza melodia maxima]
MDGAAYSGLCSGQNLGDPVTYRRLGGVRTQRDSFHFASGQGAVTLCGEPQELHHFVKADWKSSILNKGPYAVPVGFFNVHMNLSLLYKMERAPDCCDARRLLEHWFNIILTGQGFVVTNFEVRDNYPYHSAYRRTYVLGVIPRQAVSYVCKAAVKTTSLEIPEVLSLKIKELLNDTYKEGPFSLYVKPEDVVVKSIALVGCPESFFLTRYNGNYSWPVTSPASETEVSCRKNPLQSAQRSCEITIELEQDFWKKPNVTKCKLLEKLPNNILDLQDIKLTEENAQDVVQHILYLLPDATLHAEELEIIASKISDIVELADVSVTLAENVLAILDYVLLQEIEDENLRKITNRSGGYNLDDSLTMERLNTCVVSASIENASIQNLNEPVTVTLHHIDQNRVLVITFEFHQ